LQIEGKNLHQFQMVYTLHHGSYSNNHQSLFLLVCKCFLLRQR